MSSTEEAMYKKRIKTTGNSGQLYETELVGFALFKLLHDEQVEYFYLASNLNEVGCFDDLCLKAKIRGIDRPLLVSVQAKHKDDDNAYVDFDDARHFRDCYSKLVQKFNLMAKDTKNKDAIFTGNFADYECIFILYTNGKYKNDSGIDYESAYSGVLNNLISTGSNGTKLRCTDQSVKDLVKAVLKAEIENLAEHFTKFLTVKKSLQMMIDTDIQRYHAFLALHVVNVSEIIYSDEKKADFKWRIIKFREEFFTSTNTNVTMLRKAMFKKILQNKTNLGNKKPTEDPKLEEQLRTFLKEPCLNALSPLIGTCIIYKNEKIEFVYQRTESEKKRLQEIKLSKDIIEEVKAITAKNILLSLELKVPVTFGNIDLNTTEKNITNLAEHIVDLCKKSKLENNHKIVTLDDTIKSNILKINGGLGGTVGNLLVYEESTGLLQFVDNSASLRNNARLLYDKLRSDLGDLHVYRFYVTPMLLFPILSFDCASQIAREMLNQMVIYAGQSDHTRLVTKFKKLIEEYQKVKSPNVQIHVEALFQNYHSNIETWSMSNTKEYLTKDSEIYQKAFNNILFEPQMSLLRYTFHRREMKHIVYRTESLKTLQRISRQKDEKEELQLAEIAVIVTDVATLTAIKVIQYLRSNSVNSYAILDLEYLMKLPTDNFCALLSELKKTEKVLLVICHNLQSEVIWYEKYFKELALAMEGKQKIIIANGKFVDMVLNVFSSSDMENTKKELDIDNFIHENHSIVDLTHESQADIKKNSNVIFQGHVTSLDKLLDDSSIPFIEGSILNKIVFNEADVKIGELHSDENYDEIINLYQDRTVEYIEHHPISGRICISSPACVTDKSQADSSNNVASNQQWEPVMGSILSVCFSDSGININQSCLYLHLYYRTNAEIGAIILTELARDNDSSTQFGFKIKKFTNKVWRVKVTIFDDLIRLKNWLENDSVLQDTVKTLQSLCQDTIFHYLILNKVIEVFPIDISKNRNTKEFSVTEKHPQCFWNETENLDKNTSIEKGSENNLNIKSDSNVNVDQAQSDTIKNASIDVAQRDCDYIGTIDPTHKDYDNNVSSNNSPKDLISKIFERFIGEGGSIFARDIDAFVAHNLEDATLVKNKQNTIHSDGNVSSCNECTDRSLSKCEGNAYNFKIRFRSKHRIELKSFDDLKHKVVLLTAKAGLGKSTIVTHLSRRINKLAKHMWVVRINLLNYLSEFKNWQRLGNAEINTLTILNLIVQFLFKNVTVDLKEHSGDINFEKCSGDELARLNIKMFLNYYNNGKMLFICDGFDEVCPYYKNEALLFLNIIKNCPHDNKMWITSRPHNAILPELEQNFGKSFKLEYLNRTEQMEYLRRYWESTITDTDTDILERFLVIISTVIAGLDIKLKIVCYSFYKHIVTKLPTEVSVKIKLHVEEIENVHKTVFYDMKSKVHEFMGTPLLLRLMADFILNKILNFELEKEDHVSIITMYEWCINKMINVHFKEKYGMDINIPFVKDNCSAKLTQFLAIYKKLGAQAIFGNPIFVRNGLYLEEFKGFALFDFSTERGRAEFEAGKDKTGLISYITYGGTPVFIHKTFAEYFAVEYISDILTDETVAYEAKRLVLTVILSIMIDESVVDDRGKFVSRGNIGNWVREKYNKDENLKKIFNDIVKIDTKNRDVTKHIGHQTLQQAYRILFLNET